MSWIEPDASRELETLVGYQPMALDIIMVTCNSRPIPVCGTHPGLGGFQTLEVES